MTSKSSILGIIEFLGVIFLLSCGHEDLGLDSSTPNFQTSDGENASSYDAEATSFDLFKNMLQFDLEVTGCVSGFHKTYNKTTINSIQLHRDDRYCLAKLLGFTDNTGTAYSPMEGSNFKIYLKGDMAIFTDSNKLKFLAVIVKSQLSSPLKPQDTIDYAFSQLLPHGDSKTILNSNWDLKPIDLVNGKNAPSVALKQVIFTDINEKDRRGIFDFYLECTTKVANLRCINVSEKDIMYALNVDYNNDCSDRAQKGCETSLNPLGGTKLILPGVNPMMPNGGFLFERVETPLPLSRSNNLILQILRLKDASTSPPIKEAIRVWNFDLELTVKFPLMLFKQRSSQEKKIFFEPKGF